MRRTTSVSQHVIVLGCYDSAVACPRSRARAERPFVAVSAPSAIDERCFRHQLLLPRPYLVLTKPLRLDIQCQRAASVKIGWKYLDD